MTENSLTAEEQFLCYNRINDTFASVRSYLDNNFIMNNTKESQNYADVLMAMNCLQSLTTEFLKYGASGWASRSYINEKIDKLKKVRPK